MSGLVEPSDATIAQVQKIVEFWKEKAECWSPMKYIRNINQLMSIMDGSSLTNNAELALDKLFSGRVEYVFEVVLMTSRSRDGRMKHKVSCRWPGQTEWIQAEESSAKEAKKVVSLKALEVILGQEFGDFAAISDILRSLEYNKEALNATLRSSLEWIVERDKILECGVPRCSGKGLEGYFDEAILDLDPAIWRKVPLQQREIIFKSFWSQSSRSKFPQTFNLCGELLPTSSRSIQAFELLLTAELKGKVRWRNTFTRPFVAHLSWQDDCGKDFEAEGEGITLDMAKSNAARNALKVLLGSIDFYILNYVAKLFWLRGFDESTVDFKKCITGLKKSVPPVAQQRTSPRPTDLSKDSSVRSSYPYGVALEVNSSRGNKNTATMPLQSTPDGNNPHGKVAHVQHMQAGMSADELGGSSVPRSLSLDPRKSFQARHPHGVAVVRPQEATAARQSPKATLVRQPSQASPVCHPPPASPARHLSQATPVGQPLQATPVRQSSPATPVRLRQRPQASQKMIGYSENEGYFCDSLFKKIQESWKSMTKHMKEDILFKFWVDTSRSKFPLIFNLFGEKCLTTSNCYNGFMLLFSEKKSPPMSGVTWETDSDSDLHVIRCSWKDEFGMKRIAKGTGKTGDSARNAAAREALKVVLGSKDFDILAFVSDPSLLRELEVRDVQKLKRRLLDAEVPLNKQRIRRKLESQRPDQNMNQPPLSGDHSIAPLPKAGVSTRSLVGYFNESILAIKPTEWGKLPVTEREEIVYDFWLDTSRAKFPCTFNLCGERCCTSTSCLGAFMLLFSEGKTISKPGVRWVNVMDRNPCLVNCYWKDQDGVPRMASGCGSNIDYARNDAARKALQITLGEVDFRVLEHVSSGFLYDGLNLASIKLRLRANRIPVGDERTKRRHVPASVSRPLPAPAAVGRPLPAPAAVGRTVPPPAVFARPAPNDPRLRPRNLDSQIAATQSAHHPCQSQQRTVQGFGAESLRPPRPTALEVPVGVVPQVRSGANLPGTSCTTPIGSTVPLPSQPLLPAGVLFDTASAVPPIVADPLAEYFSTNDDGSVDIPDWLNDYFKGKPADVECLSDSSPAPGEITLPPFLPFDEIIGYKFPEEALDALTVLTEGRENDTPVFDCVKYVTADVTVGKKTFTGLGSTEEEARNSAAEKALSFLKK